MLVSIQNVCVRGGGRGEEEERVLNMASMKSSSTASALLPSPKSHENPEACSEVHHTGDESRSESGRLAEISNHPLEDDDGLCTALYYHLWRKDSNGKRYATGRRSRRFPRHARSDDVTYTSVFVLYEMRVESSNAMHGKM